MVKINLFFRILEIIKGSQQSGKHVFKRNGWISIFKKGAMWHFNLPHSHPFSPAPGLVWTTTALNHWWKPVTCKPLEGQSRIEVSPKLQFSKTCHYPFAGLSFIDLTQSCPGGRNFFPEHLWETVTGNCSMWWLPEPVTTAGENSRLTR